jgi:hypothetical protein
MIMREQILRAAISGLIAESVIQDEMKRLISAAQIYEPAHSGAIMMWSYMYMEYYRMPASGKDASGEINRFLKLGLKYFDAHLANDGDEIEEIDDWMSDGRGCPDKMGYLHCSRNAVNSVYEKIAQLTPTQNELTVHRTGSIPGLGQFASFTALDTAYETSVYDGSTEVNTFVVPAGYPVIVAHGLCDEGEIIMQLDQTLVKRV